MATTKKAAETAAVDYSTMNVFQKLQLARVRFLEAGVDKSGKHMKLEYKYFELADIVPKAEQIFLEIGLMMVPSVKRTPKPHAICSILSGKIRLPEGFAYDMTQLTYSVWFFNTKNRRFTSLRATFTMALLLGIRLHCSVKNRLIAGS